MVLALTAAGAFFAGRATAPEPNAHADGCVEVKATADRLARENSDAPADEAEAAKSSRMSTMVNLVLQNPSCFSAETRANSQTVKDRMVSQADSDAAPRAAQCLDPDRLVSVC